ncbi:hypothetical protein ACP4OV_010632 [Aristida adscensionis]
MGAMSWRRHVAALLVLPCFLSPWPPCPSASAAAAGDTLAAGESLSGNRTLVSAGGRFELGFFSPPGNSTQFYVGIWYAQILPVQTVIWEINRDAPVPGPSSAELAVSPDGNLILRRRAGAASGEPIWSSNTTRSCGNGAAAAAVLLDTGNLQVLCGGGGNSSAAAAVAWQSFDHPTDTLMPGGWVALNKSTGAHQSLRSWRSAGDPSTGPYMIRVDPYGSGRFAFIWNGTAIYHYIGVWNGRYFSSIPEMVMSDKYLFTYVDDGAAVNYSFQVTDPSTLSRMVMGPHGQLSMYDWSVSGQWLLHWATPLSQCDVYALCGPFGLCDGASSDYCRCLPGFQPASQGDWAAQRWSAGCARKTALQCNSSNASSSSTTDGFLPVQNVQLPSGYDAVAGGASASPGECASACLRNCSCAAYAYNGTCLVWGGGGGGLMNVQQLAAGDTGASTMFLRLAAADLPPSRNRGRGTVVAASVAVAAAAALCLVVFLAARARRRRQERTVQQDGPLLVFSYAYLAHCTKNYSQKLGMGSFGSVYRGTLPDGTAVAVKRLEGSASAQGEKQFRTEVRTLGTIQHVNLVRLRGFCATERERLLVYDYMPNGSLASLLGGERVRMLDWGARFGIMVGVARGLAYLHEQCQERIVHCDVKPENILLDAAFCPRVADLGMAKLIGREFSRALTTARGTVGYLAPEWILGLPVTAKADVYSYGMMLLELISGRRNGDTAGRGMGYFPLWAAGRVGEGRFMEVLDERLAAAGGADAEEVGRACNVACWCIQQSEALRPTMGEVVQVLEGSVKANTAPVPRYLEQFLVEDSSCTF